MLNRIKQHLKSNAFVYKVILSFLFAALIFLLLTLLFFQRVNKVALEEYEGTEVERFNQRVNAVSGQITQLYQHSMNFLSSDTVSNHLKPYEQLNVSDKVKLPAVITSLLNHRVINSELLCQCFLLIDDKYVYSAEGMHDFDHYFLHSLQLDSFPPEFWRSLAGSEEAALVLPASTLRLNGKEQVVMPLTVSIVRGRRNTKLVNLISIDSILSSLIAPGEHSTASVAVKKEGKLLRTVGSWFPKDPHNLRDNSAYKVSVAKDTINNEYLLILNRDALLDQISQRHQPLVYFTVLAIVVLLLVVVLVNVRISSPLRRMLSMSKGQVELSGSMSDSSSNVWLTTASNTEHFKFSSSDDLWRKDLIHNAILGTGLIDHTAVCSYLRECFGFSNQFYTCACIHMDFKQNFSLQLPALERKLLDKQINSLYRQILSKHFPCYIIEYGMGNLCVLMDADVGEDAISDAFHDIAEFFRYEFSFDALQIGVGISTDNINSLGRSFDTARSAVWWTEDRSRFSMIYASSIDYARVSLVSDTDLIKIRNCLRSGRFDTTKRIIENIKRQSLSEHVLLSAFLSQISGLFHWGVAIARNSGIDLKTLELPKYQEFFNSLMENPGLDVEEGMNLLLAFYQQISTCINWLQKEQVNTLASQIRHYIQEHYRENIGLDSIAYAFDLSSKHVSRVFKESGGQRLSDFITSCRIEHAKVLLRTTNASIAEIGIEVGIPSRATFFRLFRTIEGISPGEYRNNIS